ncbi:Lrp/AsnC family transcriptional regulator [Citrobacter sp. U14242]|uniref:Lrp/AsnC family transcriptional regulator n=1 Tax=Citrobacter sp. U14242 TaxID=3390192 RepID=UPI00397B9CBD
MKKNTENIKHNAQGAREIDAVDRRLLTEMVRDSALSYAELGKKVSLSAPAVHERVKRLKNSGVIKKSSVIIDPISLGKSLVAFIHVNTSGWGMTSELLKLSEYPEVEEIHSIAGDASLIMKVRTVDARSLEILIAKLYGLPGVSSTKTSIVLSTYLERTIQPEVSDDLLFPMPDR